MACMYIAVIMHLEVFVLLRENISDKILNDLLHAGINKNKISGPR